MGQQPQKIVLLANYRNDGRESMERYVRLLHDGLVAKGVSVSIWRPPLVLGRLRASPRGLGKWLGYFDKLILYPFVLRRAAQKVKAAVKGDVVIHICDHSDAIYVALLREVPHVVTCHDLTAIRAALGKVPEHRPRLAGRLYQRLILSGLRKAGSVVAVSSATRDEFVRTVAARPRHLWVIRNGMNYPYAPLPKDIANCDIDALFKRAGRTRPRAFILSVGSNSWHKNRRGLLQIYARAVELGPDMPALVFAGEMLTEEFRALVTHSGLGERVFELGKVTNRQLNALYCCAAGLFFPSTAEGFGWPVIEAQASRCRVCAAAIPVLIEVGGASVRFIDPRDASAAGAELVRFCRPGCESERELDAGLENSRRYRPDAMIDSFMKVYENVLECSRSRHSAMC